MHWICTLHLVVQSFSQDWFFLPRNMEYLSICLCHLWFLSSVSYNFLCASFVSLGKFIPRYLILFVVMVNGIDSLISLSDFSLFVYKNTNDFYVLILYSETLLSSLISSSNFLIISLRFSKYSIISSANSESFILLLWSGFFFFFFSDCCS